MKGWGSRILLLAALGAVGYWGWSVLFPNPEKVIRKRLGELARAASSSSKDSLLTTAWNASSLMDFFTPDVRVAIDVPGAQHNITGRDELLQAALLARQQYPSLKIDFPDMQVTLAPDKESATVNLTARGKARGQKGSELYVEELRLSLVKVKRDWLISEIVSVRTLS